jgi:thioredoxin 1
MKRLFLISLLFSLLSCSNGQPKKQTDILTANVFLKKVTEVPNAQLIDVRTEGEYSKGHLSNALNFDWYQQTDFQKKISRLDTTKPIFVYCLSGQRSGEAAAKLRKAGFKQVYDLQGGIIKWRAAGLPETGHKPKSMNKAQYEALLNSDKLVLIDFYGDWCAPCRLMKPYLEEIAIELKDKVTVIRINVDDNQALCKELMVDALPVLKLYKNKAAIWSNVGYVGKEDVLKQLK